MSWEQQLADALRDTVAALHDLRSGFPERELHKPLDEILSNSNAAISAFDASESGTAGSCGRCGSQPGARDLTCPSCTNLDGEDIGPQGGQRASRAALATHQQSVGWLLVLGTPGGHCHPHIRMDGCHCRACRPLERCCDCDGCRAITA